MRERRNKKVSFSYEAHLHTFGIYRINVTLGRHVRGERGKCIKPGSMSETSR